MARYLKDEKVVYGYCRLLINEYLKIPREIMKLCLKWYHLKYDDIDSDIYSEKLVKMITNYNNEWKAIGFVSHNRMVSTSKGFNNGIHGWIIHCIAHSGSYQAIGIMSHKWDPFKYNWFGTADNGYCYYFYFRRQNLMNATSKFCVLVR